MINYVGDILHRNTRFLKLYLSNTFSNIIVRRLIENVDEISRSGLVNDRTIEKPVHKDITYEDIYITG